MITDVIEIDEENLDINLLIPAAEAIREGKLVVIPTETVYGLGANALNEEAVDDIYRVKGRPSDNPMIVHIARKSDIDRYAVDVPDTARKLADMFWPGPLTIVLKKNKIIPAKTSGGLDSVALRLPASPVMRELVRIAGVPIAAPSANVSGKPSPTCFAHIYSELYSHVPYVIMGRASNIGVESTIVSVLDNEVRLLRPGAITVEMLLDVFPNLIIDDAVMSKLAEGEIARAPGMKYRHYAPEAPVTLIKASDEDFAKYINSRYGDNFGVICYEEDLPNLKKGKIQVLGKKNNPWEMAANIFDVLRRFDTMGDLYRIFSRCPEEDGIGLAVYNRLIKAAGFDVLELGVKK